MSLRHRYPDRLPRELAVGHALAALAIAGVLVNAAQWLRMLGYAAQPRALTYTEGVNAILATRPDLWFHPVEVAPHFPTIYPLGYHALVNIGWRLTGLSPFQVMHVIGVVAALAGAVAVALLVRRPNGTWTGPAVAALLYALSPAVSGSTVLGRVDHLGVALGLWALLAAREGRLWPTVGLTVAAMYVKHSLVVFPVAIALWWLVFEDERRALTYAGAVAAVGLGILAALTWATDGQAWLHLVEYNRNHPWLVSVLAGQLVWFGYTHALIVGLIVYGLLADRVRPFTGVFALAAVAFAVLTVGKVGSWVGYFLPVIAAGAWLAGDLIERRPRRDRVRLAVAVVLIAQLALYGAWASHMDPKYDADAQGRALDEVRAAGGPILAEDGTLYVKTGYGQVHEPLMMRFVYDYDTYTGDDLSDEIRAQRFTRIVIGQNVEGWDGGTSRWSDAELRAIDENYRLAWEDGWYHVYVPR